jgi:cobalt-zinc-cadmium efflux system outer membrane protein
MTRATLLATLSTLAWLAAPLDAQTSASAPAAIAVLTVEDAVREALDHNLTLMAERLNVAVADSAIRTAALRPNPVLTVTLSRPDQTLFDAGVTPHEQVVRTDYVLEGGGKRERRTDHAMLVKSVAALQTENTRRLLVLDVQTAFIDTQLAKLNLALAQENLRALERVTDVNVARVRLGDLSLVEASRTRLAAMQFANDVRQQEAKLQVARNRLGVLIGRGENGDALDVAGDLRKDAPPVEWETVRRLAVEARPDLRAARADEARSMADLRLQIANGTIDYTVSGEYHRQSGNGVRGSAYAASLSLPLPVFNRNQGEIARATTQQQQLATKAQALEASVLNETANAWASYTTNRTIVGAMERDMVSQARDVRTITEYSYKRGEASLVEFLDAVRAFNDTMRGYHEARADYARSLYALDAMTGKGIP